jgi:hypothetical protein
MSQQLIHKMGGDSVVTNTESVLFTNGTEQFSAVQAGVAVCTGTGPTVAFANPYIGALAPIVVVTGLDGWDTHGLGVSVSLIGTSGAWTGFTINISGSFFGAFNWMAAGNPN